MHFLHLTAHTKHGIFEGNINRIALPAAELVAVRDQVQSNELTYLVMHSDSGANLPQETCLPKDVLATAVLVYEIRPQN